VRGIRESAPLAKAAREGKSAIIFNATFKSNKHEFCALFANALRAALRRRRAHVKHSTLRHAEDVISIMASDHQARINTARAQRALRTRNVRETKSTKNNGITAGAYSHHQNAAASARGSRAPRCLTTRTALGALFSHLYLT